jgi:hypothetical protein
MDAGIYKLDENGDLLQRSKRDYEELKQKHQFPLLPSVFRYIIKISEDTERGLQKMHQAMRNNMPTEFQIFEMPKVNKSINVTLFDVEGYDKTFNNRDDPKLT